MFTKKGIYKRLTILIIAISILVSPGQGAFAVENKVVVTSTMRDPILGTYVVYTYNGNTYRSDNVGTAFNRNAWKMMDENDRALVFDTIMIKSKRVAQFGADGFEDMMKWYACSNQYSQAKKLWQERIAKRDFPELATYYDKSLSSMYDCYNENPAYDIGKNKTLHDQYYSVKAEMDELFNMGQKIYLNLGKLKSKQITVAVNFASYEIISMLAESIGGSATRGVKPISELYGSICNEFGMNAIENAAIPIPPEQQIATVEQLIAELETLAKNIKDVEIPNRYVTLCGIVNSIKQDNASLENRIKQEQQEFEQEQTARETHAAETISTNEQVGTDYVINNRSNGDIIASQVPENYDNRQIYLDYCAELESQIISKMSVINQDYISINDELMELKEQYNTKKIDAIAVGNPKYTDFEDGMGYISEIYYKRDPFQHNVNGVSEYMQMLYTKPVEAISNFNYGLHYLSSTDNPLFYYEVYGQFFNEDIATYQYMKNDYTTAVDNLDLMLNDEDTVLSTLANLNGKSKELEDKIFELENLYTYRVVNNPYGNGKEGANVNLFFAPLLPNYGEASSYNLQSLLDDYKAEFAQIHSLKNDCQDRIDACDQAMLDLSTLQTEYNNTLNNYISDRNSLITEYFTAKANYENAVSQILTAENGVINFSHKYFKQTSFSDSYIYDGLPVYPAIDLKTNQTVLMGVINQEIQNSPNQVQKRQEILSTLKSIQQNEEQYLRQFEAAVLDREFYKNEVSRLADELNFNSNTNISLAHIRHCDPSDFEAVYEINYRMKQDRGGLNPEATSLGGSNVAHAIEMLEEKTEFYYTIERYNFLWNNAETLSERENIAQNIYQDRTKIFNSYPFNAITFSRDPENEAWDTLKAKYYNELLSPVYESGVNYAAAPMPYVYISNPLVVDNIVSVTINNMSGTDILNSNVYFAGYDINGKMLQINHFTISKIDNLYFENRVCAFSSPMLKYKVFLWDANMKPYATPATN